MPKYRVNDAAVDHAHHLVDARRYVLRSHWGDVPSLATARALRADTPRPMACRGTTSPRQDRTLEARRKELGSQLGSPACRDNLNTTAVLNWVGAAGIASATARV
ncbi:hypothetical protein GCM10023215_46000 [Pseudonocardia yuanmonensis]|uniref:Uncharacterized protein n=1 Tax=Pseudonocardia yuanmonensis TaxID=1095914 RepID=A0ABP8XAR7_9PSEU